jgi:tripartite-type tricarboxylate transporter receptor subunit TctC
MRIRSKWKTQVAVLLAAGLVASACGGSNDGEVVDGQFQPLANGFPNGPITIIVEDDPGSSDSIFASMLQEALREISPVRIEIEHRGDFGNLGTWEAQVWMNDQEAAREGRILLVGTAPGFVADGVVVDMEKEIGITLSDFNPLISTERLIYPLHAHVGAPFNTMQGMLDYCAANPRQIRYISGGPGSGQDVTFQWYMRQFGCEVDTIIGGGAGDRARAVAAGEGHVTLSRPDDVLPHFEANRVNVLMVQGDEPAQAPWTNAVNAKDMGIEDDPFPTYRMLLMATGVPQEHEDWLFRLISTAVANDDYRSKREGIAPGLSHVLLAGSEVEAILRRLYDEMVPVLDAQGVYFGNQ